MQRVRRHAALPVARGGIDHGEIELFRRCAKLDKQLQRLVDNLDGSCVRPVDLVDDDDRNLTQFQGFAQHEARLRHAAFKRVHEQQNAVHHLEDALHLAAEVRVTRRIDDVDARVLIDDRRVLGENGDPALALEIVGIHNALDVLFASAQYARVAQHLIDQRGLAVVDMRDDGDVSNLHSSTFFLIRKQVIIQPIARQEQDVS
ncbi:hypothetical protein SDC9_87826 [bioreactor metagenome]|uniref:Uncharacterized protein n=1 Tax=bioreactor metagenome TaxID=1076179 RepID=A0A644ZJX2_9ZZZZ